MIDDGDESAKWKDAITKKRTTNRKFKEVEYRLKLSLFKTFLFTDEYLRLSGRII